MMPLLAGWYDRILANRLTKWISISYEQTAFQKGKSTIHQIFTLRLLMLICKRCKKILYIAFFDIEKAFDKVSRLLLLKKLIQLGIGHTMFEAIKRMYSCTHCILKFMGTLSNQFETCTGIKQGAHSSVLLFIIFMDGAINYLKSKCDTETILEDLHCLLHADDTAVLSTNINKFITKCDHLIDYYNENKLKLNLNKSAYMIINAKKNDKKVPLQLKSGDIKYESTYIYLGAPISDSGSIAQDLKEHLKLRRPNVLVKLGKFISNNYLCPISIKLKVLQACVNSSLTYSCETWGATSLSQLEVLHRKTVKMALGIRTNTPNDIVMIESNCVPIISRVHQQQQTFWTKLKQDMTEHPDSPLARLVNMGLEFELPYLKHYNKLIDLRLNNIQSFGVDALTAAKSHIRTEGLEDPLSKYGQYLSVNPDLEHCDFYKNPIMAESDRILLTRYRCGSHKLRIETGRWDKTPQSDRLCKCNKESQTVEHVLYRCTITKDLSKPDDRFANYMKTKNCANTLRKIEAIL